MLILVVIDLGEVDITADEYDEDGFKTTMYYDATAGAYVVTPFEKYTGENSIKTSSYINDFIGELSKAFSWENIQKVEPRTTGILGIAFDIHEIFSAKTNYEKGKSESGALGALGTSASWGAVGFVDGPFTGVTAAMAGLVAGDKRGKDFYDSIFKEYKESINEF